MVAHTRAGEVLTHRLLDDARHRDIWRRFRAPWRPLLCALTRMIAPVRIRTRGPQGETASRAGRRRCWRSPKFAVVRSSKVAVRGSELILAGEGSSGTGSGSGVEVAGGRPRSAADLCRNGAGAHDAIPWRAAPLSRRCVSLRVWQSVTRRVRSVGGHRILPTRGHLDVPVTAVWPRSVVAGSVWAVGPSCRQDARRGFSEVGTARARWVVAVGFRSASGCGVKSVGV